MVVKPTDSSYDVDAQLEHRFSREIRAILGLQFVVQDPAEDRYGGTDFVVWAVSPIKVACRLRRYDYFLKYPNEFTIRWSRPSGVDTEIHKINKGLVDYLLYGFVDQEAQRLVSYFIGDLRVFRSCKQQPKEIKSNEPPDSRLAIYDLAQFPEDFIIKRWRRGA